ncbi:hypothetical protein [Kosakonia arachidis]|nr:hypothetical protein [Kosakonia arachidis]
MRSGLVWCRAGWFTRPFRYRRIGPVPAEISDSVAHYEWVFDYFASLQPMSDFEVIEENLAEFSNEAQRQSYLASFIAMSQKGFCSYDGEDGKYRLISRPKIALRYEALPEKIKCEIVPVPASER